MATIFVKHKVKDYNTWKKAYDEFSSIRKEKGVIGASVHRDAKDPNTLVVMHRFPDKGKADAFMNSDKLKSAMETAGIVGEPEFWVCDDVEMTFF